MADKKTVYFVRHGSPFRLPDQYIGRMDSPLTEQGKLEAMNTGKWFEKLGFSGLVYSSPLSRAYDTADLIVKEIKKSSKSFCPDISIIDDLAECDFGLIDGKTNTEYINEFPDVFSAWYSDPFMTSFPEGESLFQCASRFDRAVEQILDENKSNDKDIVIASHMCTIQSYCILKGLRKFGADFAQQPIACASITAVDYYEDGKINLQMWGYLPEI